MVKCNGADGAKASQVVFEWRVVAVPSDNVQRRETLQSRKEAAAELESYQKVALAFLEGGYGRLKIARTCKTIRACEKGEQALLHGSPTQFASVRIRKNAPIGPSSGKQKWLLNTSKT